MFTGVIHNKCHIVLRLLVFQNLKMVNINVNQLKARIQTFTKWTVIQGHSNIDSIELKYEFKLSNKWTDFIKIQVHPLP